MHQYTAIQADHLPGATACSPAGVLANGVPATLISGGDELALVTAFKGVDMEATGMSVESVPT